MLNGFVMSKDIVVAEIKDNDVIVTDSQRCPLYLKKYNDIDGWLRSRAIDAHRTNSRLLRKALRLAPNDDVAAVLRVHGATITDPYWFLPAGSTLTYEQVRFEKNEFAELALYGDPDSFSRGSEAAKTPELTNVGSFEKCWKLIDGEWWMYKSGSPAEHFSELFIYHFGALLGLNMAQYERGSTFDRDADYNQVFSIGNRRNSEYIRSKNFTEDATAFEPIYSILRDEEDYQANYREMKKLSVKAAAEYVGMIYLDALILNMDRHTNNYGFLRDQATGNILSLAPLFDHNIALISRGYPSQAKRGGDLLQKLFVDFLKTEPQAISDFHSLALKPVNRALIQEVFDIVCKSSWQFEIKEDFITDMILSANQWIKKQVPELFCGERVTAISEIEEPELKPILKKGKSL